VNRQTLKDHLTHHYAGMSLPSQTADRLSALAEVDLAGPDASHLRRQPDLWWPRLTALAAGVAIIISAAALYVAKTREQRPGPDRRLTDVPLEIPHLNQQPGDVVPRLVAVKFQADGCPFAAAVEPVFLELAEKYCSKPIIFARFDLTSEAKRQQSRNLACGLGIKGIYEGPHQSGMIKLIDRQNGEVLATLTKREQLPEMENMLARAFP